MLVPFFFKLREGGVPVSITEFLSLLQALQARVASASAEDFYYLSRACLVKDERHFDRFDRAFAAHFKGAEDLFEAVMKAIPEEWLKRMGERTLVRRGESADPGAGWLGQVDRDVEAAPRRAEEASPGRQQMDRHRPAPRRSARIGYNPEGVRIGQDESRNKSAVKVWDQREFRISTTPSRSVRATSRSHYASFASSPAKARRSSWIWTTPSTRRPATPACSI